MNSTFVFAATAVLAIGAAAGCSSNSPAGKARAGTLPPGTATVMIDGKDVGFADGVECTQAGPLTIIRTGHNSSEVTAVVSNADKLAAEIVRINDLNGFAGSYDRDLQGNAAATLTDATYEITGEATGLNKARSSALVTETFALKVAC